MTDRACILRIEKLSIQDGHGIRTVVFFKGCPLRCKWCSTPESQAPEPEEGEGGIKYGRFMSVDDVMKVVLRDTVFYYHSGGGVTLSGGDVLMQAEFAEKLLEECKGSELDTAIETELYSSWDKIERLIPYTDSWYVDIKHMDPGCHLEWTGVRNEVILENLRKLSDACGEGSLHVRIPLIRGANADEQNLRRTIRYCEELGNVADVEILPFHRLGSATYEKLGRKYYFCESSNMTREEAEESLEFLREEKPAIPVIISGKRYI